MAPYRAPVSGLVLSLVRKIPWHTCVWITWYTRFNKNKHIYKTNNSSLFAMAIKSGGDHLPSLGLTPISDSIANSVAKVIIKEFYTCQKSQPDKT
jgi:hypothetical protein